jgi:hypothetical protein
MASVFVMAGWHLVGAVPAVRVARHHVVDIQEFMCRAVSEASVA